MPSFGPAFSGDSAGFGLVAHQHAKGDGPKLSRDCAKNVSELTRLKIANLASELFMVGGGATAASSNVVTSIHTTTNRPHDTSHT